MDNLFSPALKVIY